MSEQQTTILALLNSLDRSAAGTVLTFEKIIKFVALLSRLKNDILLVQPADFLIASARPCLSPSIQQFLSEACAIPLPLINHVWEIFGHTAWSTHLDILPRNLALYQEYGHRYGITYRTIFPPSHYCDNKSCDRSSRIMLKKSEGRQAVLFTLDMGAIPVWAVHLYCERCKVNYHHNYRVFQGKRIYYDPVSDVLQIGEHQFAEARLINQWANMMLLSWTSATNCARIYNITFANSTLYSGERPTWQFHLEVTSDQVYDAFTLLSLLEDCTLRKAVLIIPHTGLAKDRFTAAVQARNNRLRLCAQPELFHYCFKCTRFFPETNKKTNVAVLDGITLGRRCCGVPNCKIPLKSNRDRFCPQHLQLNAVCAIVGCERPIVDGKKTCNLTKHQAIEVLHTERGQARFQLKERLKRSNLAHPNDSVGIDVATTSQLIEDDDAEELFDISQPHTTTVIPSSTSSNDHSSGKKVRAQFGGRRTHNEQIIVAPCGIIKARETFYNAEALYSVIEMIKRTFRHPGTMPDHLFFDNNCSIVKIVKNDPTFRNVGLTVDVFHFKCKHSTTDTFCQQNCNPVAYPELLGEGGKSWYFNSSIAEQTNCWLGGYQAICREMGADRYDFFLDEMIRRRNTMTLEKLHRDGFRPGTLPFTQE